MTINCSDDSKRSRAAARVLNARFANFMETDRARRRGVSRRLACVGRALSASLRKSDFYDNGPAAR